MKIRSRHENFETAIDEGEIRERFQSELIKFLGSDATISELFVTRAFPRKEGGFTIQYELHLEEPGRPEKGKLILCAHLLQAGQDLPAYAGTSRHNCFVLEDIGLVVPVFPYDPGLPSLDLFARDENRSLASERLGATLGVDLEIAGMEILGYRLEKRCVIRYTFRSRDRSSVERKIIAKIYRRTGFSKSLEVIKALEDKGFSHDSPDGLTVPRLMAVDDQSGVIFMEDAPGISLHFLLEKDIFVDACSAAGSALRKLHILDDDGLKNHTKLDELGNLRKLLELIYNMYPEFEDSFNKEYEEISNRAGDDFPGNVFAHRDFFEKQMLFSENRTTLLDCDNAAAADPALDVGNFVAHLALRELQHPRFSGNIRGGIEAFIKSYGEIQEPFLTRTIWWIRASRLRLAALYLLRPRWRGIAHIFLNRPIDFLGKQVPGGIDGN